MLDVHKGVQNINFCIIISEYFFAAIFDFNIWAVRKELCDVHKETWRLFKKNVSRLFFNSNFKNFYVKHWTEQACVCVFCLRLLTFSSLWPSKQAFVFVQSASGVDFTNIFTRSFYAQWFQKSKNSV